MLFKSFYAFRCVGHGVGQAVDPHFAPHHFRRFRNKKAPKSEVFDAFWSCWADSNRRPHPYQPIFDDFYNNFRLFLVVFVPNNVVSRTFEKCSLRCFHICLWWNCGQAAILRIRPLIVRNHIRCISISYSPEFFYFIYRFLQTVYYRMPLTRQLPAV